MAGAALDPQETKQTRSRVDLHTHILPGLDDGAASLAEAARMARVALADGIGRMAATPHGLRLPPGADQAALATRVAELASFLKARALPLQVVVGAETALIPFLPQQIDAGQAVTLNGSRYLLLEFPYRGLPTRVEEMLFQVQVRGLVPILAHPERNAQLQRSPELLARWVERGALVQVTAGSLLGHFGRGPQHAAERFLEAGLAHVIASDAHNAEERPPILSLAQAKAAEITGEARAQAMVSSTPAAILDDLPLEFEPPRLVEKKRWFGLFG